MRKWQRHRARDGTCGQRTSRSRYRADRQAAQLGDRPGGANPGWVGAVREVDPGDRAPDDLTYVPGSFRRGKGRGIQMGHPHVVLLRWASWRVSWCGLMRRARCHGTLWNPETGWHQLDDLPAGPAPGRWPSGGPDERQDRRHVACAGRTRPDALQPAAPARRRRGSRRPRHPRRRQDSPARRRCRRGGLCWQSRPPHGGEAL